MGEAPTINFATVHWHNARWVDVQLDYLERNVDTPYRVWAFLNDIPTVGTERFHYVNRLPIGPHAWKLNLLADMICAGDRDPDELIVFIDGDAFPVAPLAPYLIEALRRHPLVAVQRLENVGMAQPHPCFCATTVGFWREVEGDWRPGPIPSSTSPKPARDVGGRLMAQLRAGGHRWQPMLRSNVRDAHPLFFGVYDGVVYHHGAGFREDLGGRIGRTSMAAELERINRLPLTRLANRLPHGGLVGRFRRWVHPRARHRRSAQEATNQMSDAVFAALVREFGFYRAFTDVAYDGELSGVRVQGFE